MSFEKSIQRIKDDIANQTARLELFCEMSEIFEGIKFPEKVNIYLHRNYTDSSKVYVEFSPGYESNSDKDLQPLVHQLSQKFQIKFEKEENYDGESLRYESKLLSGETKLYITVSGVVPKTCQIVETEVQISDEEIELARQEALANVKTVRIDRKIVC